MPQGQVIRCILGAIGDSLSSLFLSPPFYLTLVVLGVFVVIDAYQQDVTCVFCYLLWVVALLYLTNGGLGVLIVFQLNDQGWRTDVFTWDEHQVSIALTRRLFTMDVVVILGIVVGQADDTGQRVLIVV